ncbi:MAG: 50S ribosomal protein L19e [Candidatus Methanomethyliaceae archaeon]|nr:50S ribosomal protein L19e [Candidatus Methanomethyliaceae archaeon]
MSLKIQKRLASDVLKIGEGRIWMDPERFEDIGMAITRDDIRALINDGAIKARPELGVSRGRLRHAHKQKRKGLRKGQGTRKGPIIGDEWINRIRSIRNLLRLLRTRKIITPAVYRALYLKAKGGAFHDRRQLKAYIEEHNLARR